MSPGTLTVTTAALTITANNQTKVYGGALPTLTASYSGFVNGDTVGQPDHRSRRSPRRRPSAAMRGSLRDHRQSARSIQLHHQLRRRAR